MSTSKIVLNTGGRERMTPAVMLVVMVMPRVSSTMYRTGSNRADSSSGLTKACRSVGWKISRSPTRILRTPVVFSKNSTVVYLHVDLPEIEKRVTNITTRGIVLKNGRSLSDAYAERRPLYDKWADITIDCTGSTIENSVRMLTEKLK